MDLELGNALAPRARPGVAEENLTRIDRQVAPAHERIMAGAEAGERGYCALDLYQRVDLDRIAEATDGLAPHDTVLVVGMGGSALGARAVADALETDRSWYVLDTIDPTYLTRILGSLDLGRVACHVVSKSGETVETRATFHVLRRAMEDAGVDWTQRTIATTDPDGPLGSFLADAGVDVLAPPDGVPGRYSVLSSMALPSLSLLGVDVAELLAGARRGVDRLTPSLFESPAYAYGATLAALGDRGVETNVFVPYAEDLAGLTHWFCQLWAESLGKDGLGHLPVPGRGIADHHSQLQRWRGGRHDLCVTTLAVDHPTGTSVPPALTGEEIDLARLHAMHRRGAEASLAEAGVPTVRFDLGRLDAATLGEALLTLEAATMLVAELDGIDAFDQPAVEWSKQAVRDVLFGGASEPSVGGESGLTVGSEPRS